VQPQLREVDIALNEPPIGRGLQFARASGTRVRWLRG
jgi:hypothetical protein